MQLLPWHQEADFILGEFTQLVTSSARFGDIADVALLLQMLKEQEATRYFAIELLDNIFEEVYRAMERNDFKEAQRRVAVVKFIGEAYNHKLLHTDNLFDLLYRLINYDAQ